MSLGAISVWQARVMLYVGLALLAGAIGLAFYGIPSEIPGLPDFPFVELSFPLVPFLWILSVILITSGWIFHPRGSVSALMIASGGVFAASIFIKVYSILTAVPIVIGGATIFVQPYGSQTTFLLTLGPLLAVFGFISWLAKRREWTRRKKNSTSDGT